ncbi:MAG: hypothetical protein ACJASV_001885 [Pseudorhodobacter sp.]|jgi:hypothetical protein
MTLAAFFVNWTAGIMDSHGSRKATAALLRQQVFTQ